MPLALSTPAYLPSTGCNVTALLNAPKATELLPYALAPYPRAVPCPNSTVA